MTAVDPDASENGRITYSIAGGNDAGYFAIDAGTGIIETEMKMDREVQDKYALVIHAVDHVRIAKFYIGGSKRGPSGSRPLTKLVKNIVLASSPPSTRDSGSAIVFVNISR